jgi:hypothetical protein
MPELLGDVVTPRARPHAAGDHRDREHR